MEDLSMSSRFPKPPFPEQRQPMPKELAPVYVMLATDEASYVSGATVAVTGGKPIL
jgi:hypothetical protein